ncbi:Auxin response factor 4 [Camellia lanceoleosa]|uniref:Auxin response factor 4 n=1 Tax=Camellia lanceoleosa TaxID=1840588 RepID=A0ACC0G4B9_9ERIC|nr:Auxin response factor 4 [Camellia lanceoleosa]
MRLQEQGKTEQARKDLADNGSQVSSTGQLGMQALGEGQLWRHLLQSGWSVSVSSKMLVAGNAFIFLRTSFKRI